ncbi:MAG: ATP-binding protein [Bacteriovoracaceae bacterium]|nr:ATP-binding protein [Bacteroidota bacterium]
MNTDVITLNTIVDRVSPLDPAVLCEDLHSIFVQRKTDSLVVLNNGTPIGFLSYRKVADIFSGQYGFALYQKRPVVELMETDFLIVDLDYSISEIVELALGRDKNSLYEDIVTVSEGEYIGLISISRLLLEQRNEIRNRARELEDNKWHLTQSNVQLQNALENLQQTESQLVQIEKLASIGTLAAGVAHDFNNMLSAILSSSQLLRRKLDPQSPLLKYCDIIERATLRSSQLTKQLLQFSQKHFVKFQKISINALVEETLKILERSIDKNILIHKDLTEDLPFIEADDSQIQQVIMNLALNSRDAMKNGGVLTLSTDVIVLDEQYCRKHLTVKPGRYVRLTIQDTGDGIPEEHLPKIFDPFFTTKDVGKGTGLGLSVVYGIIKKHEGNITVYSEPGIGTKFSIYLMPSEGHAQYETKHQEALHIKGSGTILMIDDEEMLLEVNAGCIRELGYTVLSAQSGASGLSIYRQKKETIDLVLLDMMMPMMSGQETFRLLKIINPEVKVFFISGYTNEDKFKSVIDEGALGLIRKPFELSLISKKINEGMNMNSKQQLLSV